MNKAVTNEDLADSIAALVQSQADTRLELSKLNKAQDATNTKLDKAFTHFAAVIAG